MAMVYLGGRVGGLRVKFSCSCAVRRDVGARSCVCRERESRGIEEQGNRGNRGIGRIRELKLLCKGS